jgi:uncharacterized membrane protein YdbT with pleckstrin-like domain
VGYPEKLLHGQEQIVIDTRPHWIFMVPSTLALVVVSAVGIWAAAGDWWTPVQWLLLLAIVVVLGWWAFRLVRWISTMFVLTTDRLISREGILRKHGLEIPLERVNTVFFEQKLYERIIGAGDIAVESASERGTQRFENIRKPDLVQREIYVQMEDNENRKFDRINAGTRPAASLSPVEQVERLQSLLAQGTITPEQFEAEKARILGG